ncbi:hypothetical protein FXW35_03015 [Candidatus Liberibacter asiaticus]|nr:hypothetical protein FXW35_03015 [Candidatus Liberibacter asiaticus]
MTPSIVNIAYNIANKSCSLIANAIYDPIPGRGMTVSPTTIISEATTKNHPPDIDIIMFHTNPGMLNGTPKYQNFCQPESLKLRDTSSKSLGILHKD